MKVFIDTNVLVSAILKDRGPEAVILFVAERNDMEWIVSPEIMKCFIRRVARQNKQCTKYALCKFSPDL